jgi:hypothetical protein
MLAPSVVPAVAVWPLPELIARFAAAPAVAVALNVTGDPVRPVTVAVADCDPAAVPSVHVVPARPLPFVDTDVLPTDPLPAANVTLVPLTAFPYWSVTFATMLLPSVVPTVAVWLLPELIARFAAAPAFAVALKLTGEPVRPVTLAVAL